MIRPLTCLSLVAALGAGLYLYQEKHRAQLLDRDITRTVKQAEQSRERIGLLKAEWALLNEPERLAGLAGQHLSLQPLQPTQFVRVEDLRSRLPPVSAMPATPAAMDQPPMAAAVPAQPSRTQLAAIVPAILAPAPVRTAALAKPDVGAPALQVAVAPAAQPAAAPVARSVPSRLQLAAAKPREAEPAPRPAQPERRTLFAPVMPAYAPAPVMVHAPTVQTASAMTSPQSTFVGSALGMGRAVLAAPVPVSSMSGYATTGQ